MIVLDASLVVKLLVLESDSATVRRWYINVAGDVAAPDLLAIEVAQAVVRRVNARETDVVVGRKALAAWRTILDGSAIGLVRTLPVQVDAAIDLALRLGHPVKDCVYLSLAIENHGALATCDARFAAKARSIYPKIILLGDHGS